MAKDWIDDITEVVKAAPDTRTGWPEIIKVCRNAKPSDLWSALPVIKPTRDVASASQWLKNELRRADTPQPVRGLYLGLDTLNMDDAEGYNVEIAATENCDPSTLDTEWPWDCEWYGDPHLIEGLRDLKTVYDAPEFESVSAFADYALFLGYSGLVLAEALESLKIGTPLLTAWGFHDGDLFFLGRSTSNGFERICTVF